MQPMVVDPATTAHRNAFAERLRSALIARFGATSESGWAAALKKTGTTISQQGLHKWLSGDALPAQARWAGLASALRVDVKWLRDGVAPIAHRVTESAPTYDAASIPLRPDQTAILQLWEALDANGRRTLQEVGHAFAQQGLTPPKDNSSS